MATVASSADQSAAHFLSSTMLDHQTDTGGNLQDSKSADIKSDHVNIPEQGQGDIKQEVIEGISTAEVEEEPVIDIIINNVVSSFSTRCHLNLKKIAMEGINVEYRRENGMLNMKIRRPYTTASMWSSGKITCTGATSEEFARIAARRFARTLQRLGFNVKFCNFRVVNVLATCILPFGIKITNFSRNHRENASYEPELHPGVTYRIKSPKATLKIFSTGSITVTAPCVANVQSAIEHIFPLVYEYKSLELKGKRGPVSAATKFVKKRRVADKNCAPVSYDDPVEADFIFDGDEEYSDSDEDFDSDESQD